MRKRIKSRDSIIINIDLIIFDSIVYINREPIITNISKMQWMNESRFLLNLYKEFINSGANTLFFLKKSTSYKMMLFLLFNLNSCHPIKVSKPQRDDIGSRPLH